jgi:hypothetical protein
LALTIVEVIKMTIIAMDIETASLYKYCKRMAHLHDTCDLDMFEAQAEVQGQILTAARKDPAFLPFVHAAADGNRFH